MRSRLFQRALSLFGLAILIAAACATGAGAQVAAEVTIGVTPKCPYPDAPKACFYGAFDALRTLEGIDTVDASPNTYNCTATVYTNGNGWPKIKKWERQFRAKVHDSYQFRGVEVTVIGIVKRDGDRLSLTASGVNRVIVLSALKHKLQWNYKKRAARQPEPDEVTAFQTLGEMLTNAGGNQVRAEVRGPAIQDEDEPAMEVRECYLRPTPPA